MHTTHAITNHLGGRLQASDAQQSLQAGKKSLLVRKLRHMSRAVEIKLPKQKVAGSNPVSRSTFEFEFSKTICVLRKSC